jgi:AcrR family transcriptional regulator
MARPRQDAGVVPARQRLEDAFWETLAEKPYRTLTMGAIARRAWVNHNTFYYYFDNLDDMAARLLEANLVPEFPASLLAHVAAGLDFSDLTDDPELARHFRRLCLVAGPHGAAWMADRVRQAAMRLIAAALGRDLDELDQAETLALTWITGGLLTVLGQYGQDLEPSQLASVVQGPLGGGIFATLAEIRGRARSV